MHKRHFRASQLIPLIVLLCLSGWASVPVLFIQGTLSGQQLIGTNSLPVVLNAFQITRQTAAGSTNINMVKDRFYTEVDNASWVTDWQVSCSQSAIYSVDNPAFSILASGSSLFTMVGSVTALATTLYGTFLTTLVYQTNAMVAVSNLTGFASGSLASNLNWSITTAYTGKNPAVNWTYIPGRLGTNTTVWPYPVQLSGIGGTSVGFQTALIAPNTISWNNHYFGAWTNAAAGIPCVASFTATNGAVCSARLISAISGPNDIAIATLESNLTSAVVPVFVFDVGVTNNVSSFVGLLASWAHRNTSKVDLSYITAYPIPIYNGGNGMVFINSRTNSFGNDAGATGGDSGSPCGFLLTNVFVLAFPATQSGDVAGDFLPDPVYWNFLTNHVPVANLNLVSRTGYPTY